MSKDVGGGVAKAEAIRGNVVCFATRKTKKEIVKLRGAFGVAALFSITIRGALRSGVAALWAEGVGVSADDRLGPVAEREMDEPIDPSDSELGDAFKP